MRHHAGGSPHEFAYRARKIRSAGAFRLPAMSDFVVAHGLDDCPAALILGRQPLEMTLQMSFDLALGLRDEAETRLVTEQGRDGADAERSGIPERIEHARPRTQLLQARLAPGEVVGLLASGVKHEFPHIRVPGEEGLSVVQ